MVTRIANWLLVGLLVLVLWHADTQAQQGAWETAGSGPGSPSTAIFATLPVTANGHPGNLGLDITAGRA